MLPDIWRKLAFDIDSLQHWVGRQTVATDPMIPFSARALAGLLNQVEAPRAGDALPRAWHWVYFLDTPSSAVTGVDGHTDTPAGEPAPGDVDWSRTVVPSAVQLFRFSALTDNAHRVRFRAVRPSLVDVPLRLQARREGSEILLCSADSENNVGMTGIAIDMR